MGKQPKDQILYDLHTHNVNIDLRDIYLHSYYSKEDDGEPGVDYRQATTFIKNLQFLDQSPNKPILVHMHSVGGCWDNGMAMFNSIQFCESIVTILVYSQASSMSGIILQAAYPYRISMPDCHFMVHYGSIVLDDNSMAVKSAVDYNSKTSKKMLEIFATNCQYGEFFNSKKSSTFNSVVSFIDKKIKDKSDWYMDAEEAVYYGFVDHILGDDEYPTVKSLRNE